MKKLLFSLFSLALVLIFSSQSFAVTASGKNAYLDYSVTNVGSSAWVQVLPASGVTKSIKGIVVSHSGSSGVYLGYGSAGGEVAQAFLSPTINSAYFPISASQNTRISIKTSTAVGPANNTGVLNLNLLYN